MTEWTVVGVIVVLLGLVLSVTKPVITLTKTITELTGIVKALSIDMSELTTRNSSSHARLFGSLDKHAEQINDHETRITILEHDKEAR